MTMVIPAGTEASDLSPYRLLDLIWPLLGRRIAFHRRLVHVTGSVKSAVLLSQAIYWTRHGRDIATADGWFHKTSAQWELETGLTLKEQSGARHRLRELGVLDHARKGAPAVLHFRLEIERLTSLLSQFLGLPDEPMGITDEAAILDLLGPPLAYHRTLAVQGGGIAAGLMLSRAIYLTRYTSHSRGDAWIYAPASRWKQEVGLSRAEQETARRGLVVRNLWEEHLRGVPPCLHIRARLDVLLDSLKLVVGRAMPESATTHGGKRPVRDIFQIKTSNKSLSSPRKTPGQGRTDPANWIRPTPPFSAAHAGKSDVQGSTGWLVQKPLPRYSLPRVMAAASDSGGGDLIIPARLLPEERDAAIALVRCCPGLEQDLLDELSGRLQRNAIHTSAIAYLRGMVERAVAGRFVPELAVRVAAARHRDIEARIERERRLSESRRRLEEESTPEFQQRSAERRREIQQWLQAMRDRTRARQVR